jgi:GntR family transcriptional regulator
MPDLKGDKMAVAKAKNDSTPVYVKLQTKIQKDIESGKLEPGEKISTERKLAKIHGVSIGTVKKVMSNLSHEGYLYRIQGNGTYVAGTTLRRETLRYYRYLKDFKSDEASLEMKFLSLDKIDAMESVCSYLNLRKNHGLYELKRLMISDKRPIAYCVSYLPQKMCKDLENFTPSKFERIPIYISLEESYGFPTISNQELFSVKSADSEVAEALGINEGTPLQLIEMLAFTYKKRPYEYRKSYCLTDSGKLFRQY